MYFNFHIGALLTEIIERQNVGIIPLVVGFKIYLTVVSAEFGFFVVFFYNLSSPIILIILAF